MLYVISVAEPVSNPMGTTLTRIKRELNIKNKDSDEILTDKIKEATDDCQNYLGYRLPRETVAVTFWHDQPYDAPDYLMLPRVPVKSITSVVFSESGTTLDPSRYRLDPASAQLYHLSPDGFAWPWFFVKDVIVTYAAGFILPGNNDCDLPPGIQGAVIELVTDYWYSTGRDPSIKTEETFGIDRVDYWVGSIGNSGELPPRVQMKLDLHRRVPR